MLINKSKTKIMSTDQNPITLRLQGEDMTEEKSPFKYLGIWITPDLDWDKSTRCAVNSYKSKVGRIKNKKFPLDIKITILNTICNKALEYHTSFMVLTAAQSKQLSQAVTTLIQHNIGLRKGTAQDQIWIDDRTAG